MKSERNKPKKWIQLAFNFRQKTIRNLEKKGGQNGRRKIGKNNRLEEIGTKCFQFDEANGNV